MINPIKTIIVRFKIFRVKSYLIFLFYLRYVDVQLTLQDFLDTLQINLVSKLVSFRKVESSFLAQLNQFLNFEHQFLIQFQLQFTQLNPHSVLVVFLQHITSYLVSLIAPIFNDPQVVYALNQLQKFQSAFKVPNIQRIKAFQNQCRNVVTILYTTLSRQLLFLLNL